MGRSDRAGMGDKPDKTDKQGSCQCPFCDAKIEQSHPFCKACGRSLRRCPTCGRVLAATETDCPRCAR